MKFSRLHDLQTNGNYMFALIRNELVKQACAIAISYWMAFKLVALK